MSAAKPRSRFWSPSSLISQTSLRFVGRTIKSTCGAWHDMFPISLVAEHIPVWSVTLAILLNLSSVSLFPKFKLKLLPCLLNCMSKLINLSEKLGDYSEINRAGQETLLKVFNFIAHQDKTIFQRLLGGLVIETNTYIEQTSFWQCLPMGCGSTFSRESLEPQAFLSWKTTELWYITKADYVRKKKSDLIWTQ